MNDDAIVLRSTIRPELMRRTLFRGSLIAGIGIIFLVLAGIFLPVGLLSLWGIPIYLFSLGLVTWGLLPYRKLTRLEKKPEKICISNDGLLTYQNMIIPLLSIKSCEYIDDENRYGIKITLKGDLKGQFFPYFSERSFNTIRDLITI